MKYLLCIFIVISSFSTSIAQEAKSDIGKAGSVYGYWGYNRSVYSNSDIHFTGEDHDFTLYDVKAKDRQTPFTKAYFNPIKLTIPQYNFRIGYFINDNMSISLGNDHMKYVMVTDQTVLISGRIDKELSEKYEGTFDNTDVKLTTDFLQLEHTDGLNYQPLEIDYNTNVLNLFNEKLIFDMVGGIGIGTLIPRSDVTLMGGKRHDEFHLAGYGISARIGFRVYIMKYFFFMIDAKGGMIHLTDIKTSYNNSYKATQNFFFGEHYGAGGIIIPLKNGN
jgi:hypothetical protein